MQKLDMVRPASQQSSRSSLSPKSTRPTFSANRTRRRAAPIFPGLSPERSSVVSPTFDDKEVLNLRSIPECYSHMECLQVQPAGGAAKNTSAATLAIEGALLNTKTVQCVDMRDLNLNATVGEALAQFIDRIQKQDHHVEVLMLDFNPRIGTGCEPLFRSLSIDNHVNTLHLEQIGLTDDMCAGLSAMLSSSPSLAYLNISGNSILVKGAMTIAKALAGGSRLQHLCMSFNKLGDEGCAAIFSSLENNSQLQALELMGCRMSDKGFVKLGLSLAGNVTLKSLKMENNDVSGEAIIGVAELLEGNRTLQRLRLTSRDIVAVQKLKALCKRNRALLDQTETYDLEKELIRLHHQSYKLKAAQKSLQDGRLTLLELEDTLNKVDLEILAARHDSQKKAKEISQTIAFEEASAAAIRIKMQVGEQDFEREKKNMDEAIGLLTQQLTDEIARSLRVELQLEDLTKQHNTVMEAHVQKRDGLQERVKSTKEERLALVAQASVSRKTRLAIEEQLAGANLLELSSPKASPPKPAIVKKSKAKSKAEKLPSLDAIEL